MAVKIVGKQNVDFSNDKGERIQGIKLHILGSDRNVNGWAVFTEFINPSSSAYNTALDLPLDSFVTLVYNRKGKVDEIIKCKDVPEDFVQQKMSLGK